MSLSLLPFPSLLRGGLHYAELLAAGASASPVDDLFAYGDTMLRSTIDCRGAAIRTILVDGARATGAEAMFLPAVRTWIDQLFGPTVALEGRVGDGSAVITDHLTSKLETTGRSDGGEGGTLRLPSDAAPTIAALAGVASAGSPSRTGASAYLVAEGIGAHPRFAISQPEMDETLLKAQPAGAASEVPRLVGPQNGWEKSRGGSAQVAIAYRRATRPHQAEILFPVSPDATEPPFAAGDVGSIRAFLYCQSAADAVRAIEALAAQDGAERIKLRVRAAGLAVEALEEIQAKAAGLGFESRDFAPSSGTFGAELAATGREASEDLLLVVSETTVAHDRRALFCLLALMRSGDIASAACAAVREQKAKKGLPLQSLSGGYFPSQVSLAVYPRLVASSPDCLGAFHLATYPVIANHLDFAIVRRELAAALPTTPSSFRGERTDLALGMLGLKAGLRNLCAGAVRVSSSAPISAGEVSDPFGGGDISAADWASILSRVTLLRELRG